MKRALICIAACTVLLLAFAAAALLPAAGAPRVAPLWQGVSEGAEYSGAVDVIVQGDVARPGRYTVPYDCTYGELFSLAGAGEAQEGYDLGAALSFEDAVLSGGRLILYVVV